MWESLLSHPRGRLSTRKYISIATAFLVVCFAYIFIFAPTTYAADAEFIDGSISYDGKTYDGPNDGSETPSLGLNPESSYYLYLEDPPVPNVVTRKAYVIYFAPGNSPNDATTANYRTYTFLGDNKFSDPSADKEISITQPSSDVTSPGTSSCEVENVGWLVCGVAGYLADGMDYLYGVLTQFLKTQPLSDGNNALYRTWVVMKDIANIAFIAGFLIIIYSYIVGGGFSTYSIKKILPRIIVAAILVNISFWVCAVAVDVSNILGQSVQDLFINMRDQIAGTETNSSVGWKEMTSYVLSGGAIGTIGLIGATGGSIASAAFLLVGILIAVVFAAFIAVIILAARQALIVILVVAAPLAFVAYLLPNTEKWFDKWRSVFLTMLLLFPIFSVIFGGSQFAGALIIQTAPNLAIMLLGMAVQVAPLVITPLLIKFSGGIIGQIAGMANNRSKGMVDGAKNWAKGNAELHKQKSLSTPNRRLNRINFARRTAQRMDRGRMHREGMTAGYKSMAEGRFTQTRGGRDVHSLTQDADIQKHLGESRNHEAYRTAMATGTDAANVQRRHDHHEAHVAKGRGDVYDNALTQHAERDLQTQVNDINGPLRQMKINADVDTAHAEFQKSNVAAEGKATFKREFEDGAIGGRALRLMNVQTSGFEKEAAAIESMLSKRAEADWERRSTTDERVQHLRLKETEASESYTRAEKQWQRTITEIQTQGASAPGILAPNNVEIQAMTTAIQTDTRATLIQDQAIESAKIVQRSDFANALKADARLRTEAAGIDTHGQVRVLASAKKAVSEELIKATNNVYDTMEYDLASDPQELERAWGDAVSRGEMSEVIAYARKLSLNAPGLRKLKPLLEQFTVGKDPLADDVMLLKEVLAGDDGFRNAGRDLEVWANNEKNPATDRPYADFAEVRNASGPYANITASRFARMNAYSQEETLYWLQENASENLELLLQGIGDENSQVWRDLKGSTREQITAYRSGGQIRNPN